MNGFVRSFAVVLLLLALAPHARAEEATRVGVVDLESVFSRYDQTQQADENLRQTRKLYREYVEQKEAALQAKREGLAKLKLDAAAELLLSREAKAERTRTMESLRREITADDVALRTFVNERMTDLMARYEDERARILVEIRGAIRKVAIDNHFTLVIDTSGDTANKLPLTVRHSPELDITERVLEVLHSNDLRQASERPTLSPTSP